MIQRGCAQRIVKGLGTARFTKRTRTVTIYYIILFTPFRPAVEYPGWINRSGKPAHRTPGTEPIDALRKLPKGIDSPLLA